MAGRAFALIALAVFGALHWAQLVSPAQPATMLGGVGVAVAIGGILLAVRRRRAAVRLLASLAIAPLAAGMLLLLAGVSPHLLAPGAWSALLGGLAQGVSTVASAPIPYQDAEPWTQSVLLAGGLALPVLAVAGAFGRRHDGGLPSPLVALTALGALYAVPVVQLPPASAWLSGVAFTLLLVAGLWLERVERGRVRSAGLLVAGGIAAAVVIAPGVDAGRPMVDVEAVATTLSGGAATRFDWNHSYGPLNWPRDGREVLRIRSERELYWKAVDLSAFDGLRWRTEPRESPSADVPLAGRPRPQWRSRMDVTVRDLQTSLFVTAGTALRVRSPSRKPAPSGPGLFGTGRRPLRDGQTYTAEVYVPDPRPRELAEAPSAYPDAFPEARSMALPASLGGPRLVDRATGEIDPRRTATIIFPTWSQQALGREPTASDARGAAAIAADGSVASGDELLEGSAYQRTYRLAQRLRARADTPYAMARAIRRLFAAKFIYTETPPQRPVPLEAFLFEDREGYCQQFSGAMALLLRMGGVPARVSSGFSPGVRDPVRDEWVVRDVDAHSWVEAWLPQIGWVTLDPTPAGAPARGRAPLAGPRSPAGADDGSSTSRPDVEQPAPVRAPAPEADGSGAGAGTAPGVLGVGGALLAGGLAAVVVARRRGPAEQADVEQLTAELARALRRA
ncbi:MAG TPA: transglutaminaseTgpA domain-containing protein, partial [Solirubrobacteraceae bacterium]|nr:transglutaminaseTgpA domain-containing protein [Solirubrobacteraceae bacterium]